MYVHRIVHLVYEALQDLPVCVSIVWHLYDVRGQGSWHIRTDVLYCHSQRSVPHRAVNCHACSQNFNTHYAMNYEKS